MNIRPAALACLALACSGAASAEEAIRTGDGGAPPTGVSAIPTPLPRGPDTSAQEIGDWARRIFAGEPSREVPAERVARCQAPPDRKPHGEVWVGVGTRGYREIGGVVTQPIGDCGRITLGFSHSEANLPERRRIR